MSDMDTKIIDAHPRGPLGWIAVALCWAALGWLVASAVFGSFACGGPLALIMVGAVLYAADDVRRLFR